METFENIYLDLSKQPGKCRIAESGLGWKPSGGGDTFTLDSSNIGAAHWSRAARGYELKILSRTSGVVQLDGFEQEVRELITTYRGGRADFRRTLIALGRDLSFGMASHSKTKNTHCEVGIGVKASSAKQSLRLMFRTDPPSRFLIQKSQIPT